jgi:hypothetical protein
MHTSIFPKQHIVSIIINIRRPLPSGMLSRWCQLKMSSGTVYHVALVRTDKHGPKSQKTALTDSAMKASQKTVVFKY